MSTVVSLCRTAGRTPAVLRQIESAYKMFGGNLSSLYFLHRVHSR
jgi:hypothetical protein